MKIITYLSGDGYARYAKGHTDNGVEIHNQQAVHPKLGKIAAIANLPEDTVGPVVFLDADMVLMRPLTEDDFADIPSGAQIAGAAMLPPWSQAALPDTFLPWQPTVEIPALNSGLLWFPDSSAARLIGAAWLANATSMLEALDYIRDELALSRTLQDLSSTVYEIPQTKGLNIVALAPGVVAWHDMQKELPATDQAAWVAARFSPAAPPAPIVPVPEEIANWRARAALELAGLLPSIDAALAALAGPEGVVARAAWNSGAPLLRNGLTVLGLTSSLELTSAQVDDLFIQAAALSV